MAELKGINVAAGIVPFTSEDKYATHDEEFGRGGYRSVASVVEMNAIPTERRKEGMLVNVIGDKIYKLVGSSFVPSFKTVNGQSILGYGDLKIEGGARPIYLTTDGLLDATTDTNLRTTDIEQLSRLFTISDEVPNIKYVGLDMGGSTFYHVEMNVAFTTISEPLIAMFIHPISGDGMVMQINVERGIATAPVAMGYMDSGSGGSSNIKILTTPDLMNINRTTSLKLNPADTLAITTFTKNDILISNSVPTGSASGLIVNIPISIQKGGNNTVGAVILGWVAGSKNYNMILSISNGTVTAQPPVESSNSSGGSSDSKPDLTIDVKTGCKNGVSTIYYRIREVVPNGYIQFVRKKKTTYRTPTVDYKQSRYSVKDLSVHNISGVVASTLQPNIWYEFPISKDDLVSTYTRGSLDPRGVARDYDMFKFKGNTHANPILYSNMGMAGKYTMVLHAGLQYNVLTDTFVEGTSANPIFKQRGEVIPIDVRLTVIDTASIAAGFKLIFAVQ